MSQGQTAAAPGPHQRDRDVIFRPLAFRHLQIKNRLLRSSISGTFDDYNGHGTVARLNWEEKFARGGVGAIVSSFVPVSVRGRILTRYATIDHDDKIPFWSQVAERAHRHDCKFLLQLSHSGRQQDVGGVENLYRRALSSTDKKDFFHGLLCRQMTRADIWDTVRDFGQGARRAKEAGLDGVELHGANGYLITQFLSSGINDRRDEYGGSVRNRARFVLQIVREIRNQVGRDFHLQMKINGEDHNDWLYPWQKRGNTLENTLEICDILEDNGFGVDAFHVSSGSTFPHPRNPPGDMPIDEASRWYDVMRSSGVKGAFNDFVFRNKWLGPLFRWWWRRQRGRIIEGINAAYAREVRKRTRPDVKVVCTGGFQHAGTIAALIRDGWCDGVTIARPLIRNPDLPKILAERDGPAPDKECTYCNKCLLNDLENPLGCYDITRYDGRTFEQRYENMMREVMSVFEPPTFPATHGGP